MDRRYKQEERSEGIPAGQIIGKFRGIISGDRSTYDEVNSDDVNAESTYGDLGMDSLATFALLGDIEGEFGIEIGCSDAKRLVAPGVTMRDLALHVENELNKKREAS